MLGSGIEGKIAGAEALFADQSTGGVSKTIALPLAAVEKIVLKQGTGDVASVEIAIMDSD